MNKVDTPKVPFWRNAIVLSWAFQLSILAIFLGIVGVLLNNLRVNSQTLGIPLGREFLYEPSSFTITGNDFRQTQPVWQAVLEGVLNTIRVAVLSIILASVLGVLIGVGRLSGNWIIKNVTRVYVETIRNLPLLGILFFSYLAIVLTFFPDPSRSWDLAGTMIVNSRGIALPWVTASHYQLFFLAGLAAISGYLVSRWRQQVSSKSGLPPRTAAWVVPTLLMVFFWGAVFMNIGLSSPSLEGVRISGGMTIQVEYFALLLALVLYTASHIAEIVRGSIQAVPKGQFESSQAMALNGRQRMRHVIFPQALRIALPAIGNQYINVVKNSSLGFVFGYVELTKVISLTVGTRSPAVPAYALLLLIYLLFSLVISIALNAFNKHLEVPSR